MVHALGATDRGDLVERIQGYVFLLAEAGAEAGGGESKEKKRERSSAGAGHTAAVEIQQGAHVGVKQEH
jgi:hypothetical protein